MAEANNNGQFEQLITRYGGIEVPPRPIEAQEIVKPELEFYPVLLDYDLPLVKATITTRLSSLLGVAKVEISQPPEHIKSDYAIPLFGLFKQLGEDGVLHVLQGFEDSTDNEGVVGATELKGPYFNIRIDARRVGASIVNRIEAMGESYGIFNEGGGKTVVFDTSSPNIAKAMTVAHLRSTVIGESLGRIYQNCGYEVIRDNHIGDWGTQFGILGRAYELWGHEVPDLQEGGDPIKGLFELYVRMHRAIEEEEESSQEGSDLKQQGLEWFKKLEQGDEDARQLWQWALGISMVEANRIYQRLGSNFEYVLGESKYVSMFPSVITAMEEAGMASIDDKRRVVIDFGPDSKFKPLPIQKSDGTSLYAIRDLATLAARQVWFEPAKILYVVGGEQSHYFGRVFEAFKRYSEAVGEDLAQIKHVAFGMVKLPEGKMSTRKGNVIFLEDVMDEAVSRARAVIDTHINETGAAFSEAEIAETAEKIGIGAVIYSELRQNRGRNIKFNWEEILSFNGNSGPYLQYTNARINAIFRKLGEHETDFDTPIKLSNEYEERLVLELGRFPEAIKEALDSNEPSLVADYLYKLCSAYNNFYKTSQVLSASDMDTKNTRLRLSSATSTVLRRGMYLLGVPMPERM